MSSKNKCKKLNSMHNEQRESPTRSPWYPLVRYLHLLATQQPGRSAGALVLMVLVGLMQGAGVLLLLPMLEIVGISTGTSSTRGPTLGVDWLFNTVGLPHTLVAVLLVFLTVAGGHALLVYWQTVVSSELQQEFVRSLQNRLYRAVVSAEWGFFVRTRSSDFTHALTNDIARVSAGTTYLPRLVGAAILTAVHTAMSLTLSPVMTAITLGSTVLLWPLLSRQNRRSHQSGLQVSQFTRSFFARVSDHLAGMKDVKCLGAQTRHIAAFEELTGTMNAAHQKYVQTTAATALIYTLGSAAVLCGLLWLAVEWLRMPLAELLLLVFLFSRLLPRIREVHASWQHVLHMLPAFDAVGNLQEQCESAREAPHASGKEPLNLEHEIEVRDVSFRYALEHVTTTGPTRWALRDVGLTIPANSTTAIVGPSGAGKSTLADVLLGLLIPDAGDISIDGRRLSGDLTFSWRQNIGSVGQDTFLLHDTVRANLLASRPSARDDELWDSLRLAAADRFVATLPQGLETVVGDRGLRLSGGERQRIALARALLRRPSVLVLDEATSALDSEHQLQIHHAIQRLHGKLTLVIIAHRLSTIRHADQIVVLDSGRIVEQGSYHELMARPTGRFRSLADCDETILCDAASQVQSAA